MNKSSDGDPSPLEANARYKFTVSYDGTLYSGFQRQGSAKTIQSELEIVLRSLGWAESAIIGAGRTDAGVHAEGQVFSAAFSWKHSLRSLRAAMNANLPNDISIRDIVRVEDSFHARYAAQSRTYRYRIFFDEVRAPIRERYAWRVFPPLSLERLNEAAALMIGAHDFCAFGSPPRKNGTTIRTVYQSQWMEGQENQVEFTVEANAFLYHMVRRMVWLQISFAQGLITWEQWQNAVLHGADAKPGLAPPTGLSLVQVRYD